MHSDFYATGFILGTLMLIILLLQRVKTDHINSSNQHSL